MATDNVTIFTDGASRGNPGPAAVSFVIKRNGHADVTYADTVGLNTNNVAEYTAMIRSLAAARRLKAKNIRLHSDSELMVKQLRGEYRVRNPDIQSLYDEARQLAQHFQHIEFIHVPRWQNAEADRLCNEALDGRVRQDATHEAQKLPQSSASPETSEILQFLETVRNNWARGTGPDVETVWGDLLALLKRHKLLKTRRSRTTR